MARMPWRRRVPMLADYAVRHGAAAPSARAPVVVALALLGAAALSTSAWAQIDPTRRDLVEFGYDQPLEGHAPVSAYLFYEFSRPQFGDAEHALRLTVSPVYLDGEWDIRGVFGPDTDVGIGVNGGGFAYDYDELRAGRVCAGARHRVQQYRARVIDHLPLSPARVERGRRLALFERRHRHDLERATGCALHVGVQHEQGRPRVQVQWRRVER